jgi:hypothetical protein
MTTRPTIHVKRVLPRLRQELHGIPPAVLRDQYEGSTGQKVREMPQVRALPQPPPAYGTPYEYVRLEDVPTRFFSQRGIRSEQLVWVCKSKGRRKRNDSGLASASPAQPRPPASSPNHHHAQQREDEEVGTFESTTKGTPSNADIRSNQSQGPPSRLELFLRARVVESDSSDRSQTSSSGRDSEPALPDDRVLVRYPKGSTYRVRRDHLLPVLERWRRVVIVVSETPPYRKCCAVHTLPTESFLEIGCDLGHNLQRVHETGDERSSASRILVGIDKSPFSVRAAKGSYPHLRFVQWDPLEQPTSVLRESLGVDEFHPDVIAVDINGSRELPAVLACLTSIWDVHRWQPRLIVVKSRTLHAHLRDGSLDA